MKSTPPSREQEESRFGHRRHRGVTRRSEIPSESGGRNHFFFHTPLGVKERDPEIGANAPLR